MTKSTITRERLEWLSQISCRDDIEDIGGDEIRELASMALAAMDSEPVADVVAWSSPNEEHKCDIRWRRHDVKPGPLYRHAQPAPEYPEVLPCSVLLEPGLRFGKGIKTSTMLAALARRAVYESDMAALSPEEKAEFQARIDGFKALIAQPAPVVPENCVTVEHRRVIEMLLNVCGAAFELADDSCQQDVDGEDCHVVPDDAFQKLSDALDEIENTLPTEDIDRPDVFLAWSAIPKAALKSLLQAGNSPVTGIDLASGPDRTVEVRYVAPPGYVMVPMRLTAENGAKGALSGEFSETKFVNCPECFGDDECETCDGSGGIEITVPVTWTTIKEIWAKGVEHFAAAPQSPGSEPATVPGKWIPVSERMPEREVDVQVYCPDKKEQMVAYLESNELEGYFRFATWRTGDGIYCQPTHWMQLPAGPKEVQGE